MSLLREIQNAAIDGSSNLETLLRTCSVLASRLKNEELKSWVQSELGGYPSDADLPDYRNFHCQAYGHFSGVFGHLLENAHIPESHIPEDLRNQLTSVDMREGVSALFDQANDRETNTLQMNWPEDTYTFFDCRIYQDMNLLKAWVIIPKSAVSGILSTVRNRILNFALEIEVANPNAGEASSDEQPIAKETVSQIFQSIIYRNIAPSAEVTQADELIINADDFGSLESFLKEVGFDDDDVFELRQAVRLEPTPKKDYFDPMVAGWIGKAVGKAAQGGMKITASTASSVLSKAMEDYYGL